MARIGLPGERLVQGPAALRPWRDSAGFTREALLRFYVRGRNRRKDMVALGRLPADGGSAD